MISIGFLVACFYFEAAWWGYLIGIFLVWIEWGSNNPYPGDTL